MKMMNRQVCHRVGRLIKGVLLFYMLILSPLLMVAQGIPLLRNYSVDDYHANNYNFDIDISDDGTIFIANFEGLLYYDQVEWRIIRTPGITRITVVYCDKNNVVWVGGYNYFGRVQKHTNGDLYLQRIGKPDLFRGEVQEIWENKNQLHFFVNDGKQYVINGNEVKVEKQLSDVSIKIGLSDILKTDALEKDDKIIVLSDVTQTEPLDDNLNAVVKKGQGLFITTKDGKELYSISETNGLCTNNVSYVGYNGHGQLWGATEAGIFCISLPSAYSHFTANEGVSGEILTINEYNDYVYVGTSNGIFRCEGQRFVNLNSSIHGCWQLEPTNQGLLAATSSGVYLITSAGNPRQLTTLGATSVFPIGNQFYSGEMDGVYLSDFNGGNHVKVCELEKVTKILKDNKGTIWLQNLYGEVWNKQESDTKFSLYREKNLDEAMTLVPLHNKVEVVGVEDDDPVPYPHFSYIDDNGVTWLTDNGGKQLYRWKDGKRLDDYEKLLHPLNDFSVRAMFKRSSEIWIGGERGLWVIDTKQQEPSIQEPPKLKFRTVRLGSDSLLWGGYTVVPKELNQLASHERNLRFTYALDYTPLAGTSLYRYRLNDGPWTAWENNCKAEFINLPSGSYTIQVQAQLATGELTDIISMDFSIAYPFYLRWYMIALYMVLLGCLVYGLFRYRLHRLNMEKRRLEHIVQERTAEVVKQKDEIEEKSKNLETALNELHQAQGKLIRQEKMATVGKLTQGLIDRILNPLNYINNFTKLSEGLVKDIEANVEDEKEHMDEENYEDTVDIIDMLRGNLQKVGEHGQNTTRTLKAMEEMLKDRSGGIIPMDLCSVLKQDEQMLNTYYANEIKTYHIKTTFSIPGQEVRINGNADQLSKTLMSLLGNSIYALVKKAQRNAQYTPEVSLTTSVTNGQVSMIIHDNGIGIEDTIIDKVFDPFFTTKPTGEASGVGLYLSHEIIQNHGGTITVQSEKDNFTDFTIVLPIL